MAHTIDLQSFLKELIYKVVGGQGMLIIMWRELSKLAFGCTE